MIKRGVMHETASWEEADRETGSSLECGPGHKLGGGHREYEKRRGYDLKLHRFDMKQQLKLQAPEGRDDALRSVSLGEDLLHILTVDMSLPRLLMLEIYAEFFFILMGAVLLTLVAAAEGASLDSTLFERSCSSHSPRFASPRTPCTAGRIKHRVPSPRSSSSRFSDGSTGFYSPSPAPSS